MEASTVVAIIRSVNTQKICKDKITVTMREGSGGNNMYNTNFILEDHNEVYPGYLEKEI